VQPDPAVLQHRHTCLTLLLSLGTPPHVAQAIAGHAHVDVTVPIYAHTGMDDQAAALRRLGDAFGSAD
jgi:integrase